MALITVISIVAAGATAWFLTDRLVDQTNEVATSTGEVLIATQQVSASLAEADASAVSVHLAGAEGNREQRRLYEQAIERATTSLERVSRLVGDDEPSHDALQEIASRTTQYAGLIESSRLASVESLPNANSALLQASQVNRNEISPEVEKISLRARNRFSDQTTSSWYTVAVLALIVALVALLAVQYMVSKRFHRIINIPLALASVVLIGLIVFSSTAFSQQRDALSNAESQAFDAIVTSQEIQAGAYRHRALGTTSVLIADSSGDELREIEQSFEGDLGLPNRRSRIAHAGRCECSLQWV